MASLHGDAWRRRGEEGVFVNPQLIEFHQALWRRAPQMAELLEVKAGEDVIAALYNLVFEGYAANYQSGLLYESDNRLAPGFLAHALAIAHYRERGLRTYSFLAGEADYKRRLGAEGPLLKTMVVVRPTWRQKARRIVKRYGARLSARTRQT
jgi:CelD/BcsL family acetyltransferase involved in cellulose biosynthesis